MLGKVLNDRYKIIKKLGEGGMALVFEAHDLLLDRQVAIKMLRPEYVSDKEFIKKFRQEAKAVARISHPNVVSIFDIARDNNYHYLVMEDIKGPNLKDIINKRGKLSLVEALDISIQICSALIVAHSNNIVHCDIKPHNILITEDKQVKVTDFGIARAVTSSTITSTDTIIGSAHYFSPEQAKGGDIKAHSDIYSAGIVLYEMITGEVPFTGESPISVALKHIQEKPQKASLRNSKIPKEVDNIILKALEKNPEDRFNNAAVMKQKLTAALKNLKINQNKENNIVLSNDQTKIMKKSEIMNSTKYSSDNKQDIENKKKMWIFPYKNKLIWIGIIALIIMAVIFTITFIFNKYTDVPIVEVPDLIGFNLEEAKTEVDKVGLEIEEHNEGVYNSQFPRGKIISQFPIGGEKVRQTRKITVTISKGPQIVTVPDVRGKGLREVEVMFGNQNIEIGEIKYEFNNKIAKDIVISQNPEAGKEIEANKQVDLVVSNGLTLKMVKVPNLIGMQRNEAAKELIINDLRVGSIEQEITKRFKTGQVSRQQYSPGENVPENEKVDLTISSGLINEENASIHTSTVGIEVMGYDDQEIRIIVEDNNGIDIVYEKMHKPGEYVRQTINSVGPTIFKIYIDGELVKQESIS